MAHSSLDVHAHALRLPLPPPPIVFVTSGDSYWLEAAAAASPAGRAWTTGYSAHAGLVTKIQNALKLMHRGMMCEAHLLMQQSLSAICSLRGIQPSFLAALNQEYHRVAGYYFYKIGEFSLAYSSMELAIAEVEETLSSCDFLLALAAECVDFCVNQARVARSQRRWTKMHEFIARGRAMMLNQAPLCSGPGGQPVFFSNLRDFILPLDLTCAQNSACIRQILSVDERMRALDMFARSIYKLPAFAIEYP